MKRMKEEEKGKALGRRKEILEKKNKKRKKREMANEGIH